ncbi:MAG: biopolymer transport protein ExbB [Myxococcota bacterium]
MSALTEFWASGGFVMPALVGGLFAMWFALAWRVLTLGAPVVARAERAVAELSHRSRASVSTATAPIRAEIGRFHALVAAVVILAPLVGLLGTVTGMIETFSSLGSGAMYTQSGGIAGGISEALVSTQTGLAVAIPGALLARLLDRRQQRIEHALDAMEPV